MRRTVIVAMGAAALLAAGAGAAAVETAQATGASAATESPAERRLNPFGDPFLQATNGRACAAPLGPAYTDAERRVQAHSRAERGTSCWLAGRCAEPNAYRYDAANAASAVAALRADPLLASSGIWVTAQRRFVYLEGCAADLEQARRAELAVQALPEVDRVIPALALPGESSPYPTAAAAPAARAGGAR